MSICNVVGLGDDPGHLSKVEKAEISGKVQGCGLGGEAAGLPHIVLQGGSPWIEVQASQKRRCRGLSGWVSFSV